MIRIYLPQRAAALGESSSSDEIPEGAKTQKCSTSDPESGWFRKGEHKHVFAYSIETVCDKHGWILGYTVHPGNEHDSRTWKPLYDKVKRSGYGDDGIGCRIQDSGNCQRIVKRRIQPLFPYKRPMTKDGFFKKYEYVYDEYYDCYICPADQILTYRTTNRDGYKEYKSDKSICKNCPYLSKCTESKEHEKVITRHIWEEYLETSEDIRHTLGNKEIYMLRKETIEIVRSAKEQHGFRYTQYIGNARMNMKAGLTFACMNLKKLAKILDVRERQDKKSGFFFILCKKYGSLYFGKKSGAGAKLQHQLSVSLKRRSL